MKSRGGNWFNVETSSKTLPPNSSVEVQVKADCINQESIEEFFEVLVRDSKSLFFQVLCEVQKPRVYLSRETVTLGKIYAGVKEIVDHDIGKHKTQSLELVNYGNLPVRFKWEEQNDPQHSIVRFSPSKGTIPPKSKVRISFEMTVFTGGQIDELLICDVEDLELPLGFEVKADAFGLNVAYLTNEEQVLTSTASNYNNINENLSESHLASFGSMH